MSISFGSGAPTAVTTISGSDLEEKAEDAFFLMEGVVDDNLVLHIVWM
jgi:hypothetical protein